MFGVFAIQFFFKQLNPSIISPLRMTLIWTILLFLNIFPVQSAHFPRPSFLSVKSGQSVSLNCPFEDIRRTESVVWYKQIFGEMPQKVGEQLAFKDFIIFSEFKTLGFAMEKTASGFTLTIQHVIKKHGGLYYCEKCTVENITLSSGMFLTVTGDDEDVSVSVLQNGELDSVPAGASVTLQCSVLSESIAAELQVLWFRAAPSQSHPQIIYTHHNSSLQCESSTHTCVYNLSKNIFSLNDTGTYYCAVVLCGKIIFGNGTRVQLEKVSQFGPEVMYLTVVVVVCVVVIFIQAFIIFTKWNGEHCRVRPRHESEAENTTSLGNNAVDMNYAAVHFSKTNSKRETRKRDQPANCIYSSVSSAS